MKNMLLLTMLLAPTAAWAHHRGPPPDARVVVVNESGTELTVRVSGQGPVELRPGEAGTLRAYPGDVTVKATYHQFGADRTLASRRLNLYPGETERVVLAPEHLARVLVTNDTDRPAELMADGRDFGRLEPNASRLLTIEAGPVDLSLLADGRAVDRDQLDLRPYAENRWVARRPPLATVTVTNPFPVPIELVCSMGMVRTVQPRQTATYDVPAGEFTVTARRVTDETIDVERFELRPGERETWSPAPPRDGFLTVDSDHFLATRVNVDGKTLRTLAPYEDARIALPVGWHRVSVRDEQGRILADTWVEIDPFDPERIDAGGEPPVAEAGEGCHMR